MSPHDACSRDPSQPRGHRLSVIALASLTLYILACRPGFSPDGTKVLVTAVGGVPMQGHLLAYDRQAAKWMPLLTVGDSLADDASPLISANWSSNGKEVVAAWPSDDDHINVAVLPVGDSGHTRLFRVADMDESPSLLIVPPVLHREHVFFGGESITVLNLQSGVETREVLPGNEITNAPKKSIHLIGHGGGVYYLMAGEKTLEMGRLDLANQAHPRPVTSLQLPTTKDDSIPFLALSRVSSRLAVTRGDADNQRLEIYRQSRLERTFAFGATNTGIVLGNLVWSADGKTLYAAGFKPLKPGPIAKAIHAGYDALRTVGIKAVQPPPLDLQMLLCEIPLDGGPITESPLFRIASGHNEFFLLLYQIALSPDGKTIATSAGVSENDQGTRVEDRALYLIDLTRASRRVIRVPLPRHTVMPAGID